MSTADLYDAVARVGQALSSGTRLKMLELLAQGERPVVELAGVAGLNVTTASAHLQALRTAGLVSSRRDSRRILYRLSGTDVAALVTQLCAVAEAHRPEVRAELAAALPTDDIRLMDRAELLAASDAGQVVVLDVRPGDEYAAGHLPGAMSIPLDELAARTLGDPRRRGSRRLLPRPLLRAVPSRRAPAHRARLRRPPRRRRDARVARPTACRPPREP